MESGHFEDTTRGAPLVYDGAVAGGYRIAGAWVGGRPVSRRELLRWSGLAAAGLILPGCSDDRSAPRRARDGSTRDAAVRDAGQVASPPVRPVVAPPPSPVRLAACRPIAEVAGAAAGFLGDDFTRPHEVLWTLDAFFAGRGGVPAPRERAGVVIVGGGLSGLGLAWRLRDLSPIVLEQAPRFGGNAKAERWNGIEYSLATAYFAKPERGDPLATEFYRPLGLDRAWRVIGDDPVVTSDHLQFEFWRGTTDRARAADFARARRYFVDVLRRRYPDLPTDPEGDLDAEELAALDRRSLREELEDALGEALHPHVATLCDHYAWSTFLCGWEEVSAAAFLSSYVAEFDQLVALPGGNAFAAERLLERLAAAVPPTALRPGTMALRVALAEGGVDVTAMGPDGAPYTIRAKAAVLACPKFVAKKIVADLPAAQRTAIERIRYRSYVVANALVDAPTPDRAFDVYLVGDAPPERDLQAASSRQGVTDVVLAHWAKHGDASRSVLTLYRPYPWDGARALLLDPGSYPRVKQELERQLPSILALFGLRPEQVTELRIARWGHAMNVSEKGLVADGTWARARETIGDRIFFCEQDNWPAPCIETAFTCALATEPAVRRVVG
jgi:predicted NAD/FAD-binding protein